MLIFLPGLHMSKREERMKRFLPVLIAMFLVGTTKLFPATVEGSAQLPVPPNFLWLKLGEAYLEIGRREDVQLIPMGSSLAILRRVTFPVGRH
jgi:hypothetical protein